MKIYIPHSTDFDYKNELYLPIRNSDLNTQHEIILPHENSNELFSSLDLFQNKKIDLVISEASFKSTGMGIELGWANAFEIPIFAIYKTDSLSKSVLSVSKNYRKYSDQTDMILKIQELIKSYI